jgi:hypothetical protein
MEEKTKKESAHKETEIHDTHKETHGQEKIEHTYKEHIGKKHKKEKLISKPIIALMVVAVLLVVFNQFQINSVSAVIGSGISGGLSSSSSSKSIELANINVDELQSTAHTLQAVFQLDGLSGDEVMAELFPTGTPDYGEELGVTYDDPVTSLSVLAKMYRGLMAEVQQNNPEGWDRYLSLASKPVGISCEYCCGLNAIGIRPDGSSSCGCQHNPALLTVALYLSAYTDYTDGEILREVMKWKTLFFPKNMIELGASLAGGDTSALENCCYF